MPVAGRKIGMHSLLLLVLISMPVDVIMSLHAQLLNIQSHVPVNVFGPFSRSSLALTNKIQGG